MTSSTALLTSARSPEPVPFDEVWLGDSIARRPVRSPNIQAENAAYIAIARKLATSPLELLQLLMDTALSLCDAGSAGVSLLEDLPDGERIFRWTVLAGRLAPHIGGQTPRNFSPCGTCLDRGTPAHFKYPERRFTHLQAAGAPLNEVLVLPFDVNGAPGGTIWIVMHDDSRVCDMEDVRIMTRLATFTGAAYSLLTAQTPS